MPNDRRQIFNAAYSVELGDPAKTKYKLVRGVVNGWQVSGLAQMQSGINLGANTAGSFNMDPGGYANPLTGYAVSARSINGTDSIALRPQVTCGPTSNLGSNQYVNGSCYQLPVNPGSNGPDDLARRIRPGLLEFRPRAVQELPDQRIKEDPATFQRLQLPEPPALQLHQRLQQPEADLRSEHRPDGEPELRHRHRKAGPPHHPDCDQVLLLSGTAASGFTANRASQRISREGWPSARRIRWWRG